MSEKFSVQGLALFIQFSVEKKHRAPAEVASSVIFPLSWLCCFLPPRSLPFGAFCHAAMATLRVNHYPRKFRRTGNKLNRGERKMSFLLLFGGGSCLAALQVSFHVLTLENTEVSCFFISFFFFYLHSIYEVYQSFRALKFYILYNRRESELKVTNLKLMR